MKVKLPCEAVPSHWCLKHHQLAGLGPLLAHSWLSWCHKGGSFKNRPFCSMRSEAGQAKEAARGIPQEVSDTWGLPKGFHRCSSQKLTSLFTFPVCTRTKVKQPQFVFSSKRGVNDSNAGGVASNQGAQAPDYPQTCKAAHISQQNWSKQKSRGVHWKAREIPLLEKKKLVHWIGGADFLTPFELKTSSWSLKPRGIFLECLLIYYKAFTPKVRSVSRSQSLGWLKQPRFHFYGSYPTFLGKLLITLTDGYKNSMPWSGNLICIAFWYCGSCSCS